EDDRTLAARSPSRQRSIPTVVTTPMPRMLGLVDGLSIVHVGTSPRNKSTYGFVACGWLVNPSPARCSGVNNEHGSTPSNRTSRGRGGRSTPVGADGVPSTAVVQPAATRQATRSNTSRTGRDANAPQPPST